MKPIGYSVVKWLTIALIACISTVFSQDPGDCSFDAVGGEVSSCNLMMDAKSFAVADWRTGTGQGTYFIGGPETDNGGSTTGGYGFTTTTDMAETPRPHKKSWMGTPVANTTGATGRCVSFAYAIDGLTVDSFNVLLLNYKADNVEELMENGTAIIEYQKNKLWSHIDTTYGEWEEAHVSFTALGDYSLVFEATPNLRYSYSRGYVAVDDIKFKDGPCENECMFDSDTCTWQNEESEDDFDWSLGRSSTKRGTGPSRDQAASLNTNIVTGGYAFIDSSYPRRTGDKARLVSALQNATAKPLCVKFWLNMHGGGLGDIRLLYSPESNPNTTTELWKLGLDGASTFGTDMWNPCQQTVSAVEPYRLIFEASVGFPGAGDIGLDTISFNGHSCPSVPPGSNSGWGDCDFLNGLCGWVMPADESSSCQMLERVAENSYNPPGHTPSEYVVTDMYMKFDLGCYRNQAREKAALTSQTFTTESPQCLSFWVYMYTTVATQTKFGALSVNLVAGGQRTTIWRLQNQQQAGWVYAQVPIPAGSSLAVELEGTKGPNVIGMIGVDDVAIFNSNCQAEPAQAKVESSDCTFDDGSCLYTIINPGGSDLLSNNFRFADKDTLNVIRDHTFEADEGGFMFMDSLNTDVLSHLKSPYLASNKTYCLSFYFASFYSDNAAKLSIYRDESPTPELLWVATQALLPPRPTTNTQVRWHYAQVELEEQSTEYKFYFQGEVRVGGWAIDDVKLFTDTAECEIRPEKAKPS